jgi:Flp pilus assembly protein TadD
MNELPKGKTADAVAQILGRLNTDGANADLREKLGRLLLEEGYPNFAIAPLKDAFYLRPGRLSVAAVLARAFVEAGKGEHALELSKRLVDERPYHYGRWLFLAELQRRLGLNDEALASAGRCLLINPEAGEARVIMGYILADRGSAALAKSLLERAAEQEGTDRKAIYHRLGQLAMAEEDWQSALEYLRTSLKEKEDFAAARNDLGVVYARLGRWKEARQAFEEAVSLDPQLAEGQLNLANLLVEEGNKKEARASVEAARQVGTDRAAFYVAAGRLFALDVSTATGRSAALGYFKKARPLVNPETRSAIDRAVAKIESLPPPAQVQPAAADRQKEPAVLSTELPIKEPAAQEEKPAAKAPPTVQPAGRVPVAPAPNESTPADEAESFRPSVD